MQDGGSVRFCCLIKAALLRCAEHTMVVTICRSLEVRVQHHDLVP